MQAKITQQANLAAGKRAPPIWAMLMILFLGWNEFVAVVWNPIYLVLGLVGFVFGYMLYAELDVDARMQQGWVSGLLSIWSNFGDAVRNVRSNPGCAELCFARADDMRPYLGLQQPPQTKTDALPRSPLPLAPCCCRFLSGRSALGRPLLARAGSCLRSVRRAPRAAAGSSSSGKAQHPWPAPAASSTCHRRALCGARTTATACNWPRWVPGLLPPGRRASDMQIKDPFPG